MGAEQALVGKFPVPLHFMDDENKLIQAKDLDEFVVSASDILDSMDVLVTELKRQTESSQ